LFRHRLLSYRFTQNTDHTNYVANPNKLAATELGEAVKQGESLAAPITHIRKVKKKKKKVGA
jgi:hypothetical protein